MQAGAGLVADSVPEREYQETVNKARALIAALEIAHNGGERASPRKRQRRASPARKSARAQVTALARDRAVANTVSVFAGMP